ncbi:sigma-54-dependent Fis family transcriptional regulator [Azospirillum sp. YIM B02556]|uniref:Sigma-54-dependent Fis family transcriptional regulator n=1 Tax=Azospirillum endophyticum TaxID=2800326 RepID=A0ABS1FG23_9PROT|nr:sigma-54 dependent transcriptional regulator [Azospirillum endophyticum]MBK1842339.1 sigma-54-dependent Fis family transcriptional regulator [Azospirillum endophyticum]
MTNAPSRSTQDPASEPPEPIAADGVTEREPGQSFSPWMAEATVLVVDDEPGMRNFLVRALAPRCKRVAEAEDTAAASRMLDGSHFDLIVLDNIMAGRSGIDWLQHLRNTGFFGEVILITAFADLDTAIRALRAGASDFVLKPFRSNQILNAVGRALDRARLQRENFVLKRQLTGHASLRQEPGTLVGTSTGIRQARAIIDRVAPLPTTVLITGESGTGKEVTARALHTRSPRADKPFVPVNCAAIPPEIIESELFGHLKGAFTGAASSREGLFFYAQGGTLFLDEIGELAPAMQSKLLRVIEDKRVRPVGSEREAAVDVRLIAATNADLAAAVAAGRFRQDLYYRLNVMSIHLPPLRDRAEDVEPLARLFMADISAGLGVAPLDLTPGVLADLQAYDWPGNARELRNVIERSLILGTFPSDVVTGRADPLTAPDSAPASLEAVEKSHILAVLEAAAGNRAEAARRLGVSRKTLDRKCAAWNV